MEILFITTKKDPHAKIASDYLKQIFPKAEIVFGVQGEKFPEDLPWWKGDYIFSYLSPWIIPNSLLERAEKGAINWHIGTTEYPGIGSANFAIYNKEKEFGITCHHIPSKNNEGKIIETERFAILEKDTVFTITQKCYSLILNSFYRLVEKISNGELLPTSDEVWKRKPITRNELDLLSEIKPDMTNDEIEKRIIATTYDKPCAFIEIKGKKFYYREE